MLLQLPDYFEVIEQPMDFGTLRKKLDDGVYKNLEELEVRFKLRGPSFRSEQFNISIFRFEFCFDGYFT